MEITSTDIFKILLAGVLGGAIGLERQLHHKAAGFRTITLICIGACLYTILSILIPTAGGVAATIVTGIGFLGAGVILHETNRVTGLTTAATIWLSAAVGMGVGAGAYLISIGTTLVALVVVRIFSIFERRIEAWWEARQYQITMPGEPEKIEWLLSQMKACGLKGNLGQKLKQQKNTLVILNVYGSSEKQNRLLDLLMADPSITDIQW